MFTTEPEPTYQEIDGNWITPPHAAYGVIHRMAVSNKGRSVGLGKVIFHHFESVLVGLKIKGMRIDTHHDNIIMQSLLKKMGYTTCGVITLQSGAKRLAFEKVI